MQHTVLTAILPAALLCGCGAPVEPPVERGRPVEVVVLEESAPPVGDRLTGVAAPFREEAIGFEVGGRIEMSLEVGFEVRGPLLDEDGRTIRKGDVIAKLDATRYAQQRDAAKLKLATRRKALEAQRLEAGSISQADLDRAIAQEKASQQELVGAKANLDNNKTTFQRIEKLFESGNATQQRYEDATTSLRNAEASHERLRQTLAAATAAVASARAKIELNKLQIEQSLAEIQELEQSLEQAERDVADCELRAPFSGRITVTHSGRGGYVQPGAQVVTLTMMHPLKVVVTVNDETSRKLVPGKQAALFPKSLVEFTDERVLLGSVWGKAEVADETTRTYEVDIVVRNLRREFAGGKASVNATIRDVMPVIQPQLARSQETPLYVFTDCIRKEADKKFVYRLPGVTINALRNIDMTQVFRPEKVEIRTSSDYLTFVNYSFIEIAPGSDLEFGQYLIQSPQPAQLQGAVISRHDWAMRPGELVPVSFDLGSHKSGIYVPVEAIDHRDGKHSVFLIGDGDVARRTTVTVHESIGGVRRIEGDGIEAGARIATTGRHYLADGDKTRVLATR